MADTMSWDTTTDRTWLDGEVRKYQARVARLRAELRAAVWHEDGELLDATLRLLAQAEAELRALTG